MKEENRKALQTMKCPRCGARLFTRDVFDEEYRTANEFFELYDQYGHSFLFSEKDLKEVFQK